MEIHTAEPLAPVASPLEVEIVIEKLKRCKFPGIYYIQTEWVQAGGETLHSEIHKLINSV
jgi:hypothetical protein